MTRVLTYRPPRIALGLFAVSALAAHLSPTGTVLHLPYPFLGTALTAAGFAVMMWAWVSFRRAKTAVCPTSASSALVTTGVYRVTRNPMYLGMLGMLCGAAFFLGDLPAFLAPVAFFLVIDKVFIPYEEEDLRGTFRAAYEQFVEHTRRWL
jgi:protein-S-isoprenylcysteine O-methyltransferase Ste14